MRRGDYDWKSFSIKALEDGDSGDKTVTFTHEVWGDDAECPVHNRAPVTIRIIDDEGTTPPPQSSLTISDTTVTEGDTAEFVVTLNPASNQNVTVGYTTVMARQTRTITAHSRAPCPSLQARQAGPSGCQRPATRFMRDPRISP